MRVVVLGGGIVGVSSAYFLAKEGHEVVLVERESEVGQDASAGNAGLIAPGHSYAWASPNAPKLLVRSLAGQATSIRMRPKVIADPKMVTWGLRFLRECTADRAKRNTLVKHDLCRMSHGLIKQLAADEGIDYAVENAGMFYLYPDEQDLQLGWEKTKLLRDNGEDLRLLDPQGVVEREPVFAGVRDSIAGAIFGADDASGDCEAFTRGLAKACERLGVELQLGRTLNGLRVEGGRVVAAQLTNGEVRGDAYVLSLGTGSAAIAATAGLNVPVYPAKGYSVTFPVKDPDRCPHVGGVDESTLVAWSRMGDYLRMSSTAEFAGYDRTWRHQDFEVILETGRRLFPDAAHWDRGRYRACLRPMTPDGPPLIGRTKVDNLWLNTGQGHMGWTMGPGSGRLLADIVTGKQPTLSLAGMEPR